MKVSDGVSVSGGAAVPVTWTSGSSTAGAVNFLGVVDTGGRIIYPSGNKPLELPLGTTSYTIPSNWTSVRGAYIYTGIGTPGILGSSVTGQAINDAASGSNLKYGGILSFRVMHAF